MFAKIPSWMLFAFAVMLLISGNVAMFAELRAGTKPYQIMQILLSLVVAIASLYVILSGRYAPKDKHWAYATIGTVVGFWLHVH